MENIIWLFDTHPIPYWPVTIYGWLGWFVFLGLVIWLVIARGNLRLPTSGRNWGIFIGLACFVVIFNLAIGLRLPVGSALPLPDIPQEPRGPAIMLFSAFPIFLAGVMLGPLAAAALGFLAGILRFLWDTHSIFSLPELALLAILFSLFIRQRYRTLFFALLREPLIAAVVLTLLYAPVYITGAFLVSSGSMVARLDYALAGFGLHNLAVGIELMIAGLFVQLLVIAFPGEWGRSQPLQPSPVERSIEVRFLFGTGTLIILLLLVMLAGAWFVAGSAARDMLNDRLKGTAELTSQSVPFFLETGQNLAAEASKKSEITSSSGADLSKALEKQVQTVPYFEQMLVFDQSKNLVGSYSSVSDAQTSLFPEENAGLELALNGVPSQIYAIPPANPEKDLAARISFIVVVNDPALSQSLRVLIARTDLATNPFTLPLLTSLRSMSKLGGNGLLLDETGRIIFHPVLTQLMSQYSGQLKTEPTFFDDTAPNGTRNLVYYQPVTGRSWAVVLIIPAQQAQQLALTIAAPLSLMIFLLAIIALVSLRVGLKSISNSLQTLAVETVLISQGQLDHSLTVDGVDEVGQFRRSFEEMRLSLQARLAELNGLLLVSQGVASSLDVHNAVQPVLEAVLATGAAGVRMVMPPFDDESGQDKNPVMSLGPAKDAYALFDDQVITFAEQQERLFVSDARNSLGLIRPANELAKAAANFPVSLFAILLRYENNKFGVLLAGYAESHQFSDSDKRFLMTLAGQAALAASNHNLFRTAEVGRQRLAAILASTPDPVLVIDQHDRLLLANPAALQVLGRSVETGKGQPIEKVIEQKALLNILRASIPDKLTSEVTLADGRFYLATASAVVADDRPVGRVCILRDVTHFKDLDTVKTVFVNTVSHDLRSPLTLIRGYATMLEMMGSLNDQQQSYVRKIVSGVENMARLVNTLLDIGRVEAGVGLELEIFSLLELIEQVTGALQLLAVQKNIDFIFTQPKNPTSELFIEADRVLFQQVIYNLIENAIKYTPRGGRIILNLQITAGEMLLEVKDNGIGIDPKDQPRLFEKFYRGGQREAREQKGSGLGLAIVKSITEYHGGRVWLESRLGKGSTFFLKIPLRQPQSKPK